MAGLMRCIADVCHFDYFGDDFATLAPADKDNIRKRALKRFYTLEERNMKAAV